MKERFINLLIKLLKPEMGKVSDGYHTFDELYTHRIRLWIALCRKYPEKAWRAKRHSDGSSWKGWFIIGMNNKQGKQITYHIPQSYWHVTNDFRTLGKAYKFDGHTPEDVLYRITNLYSGLF